VGELQTFCTQDLSFARTKGPYRELSFPGLFLGTPWLKTRSTGADVHGVQKRFPKVASGMEIVYIYLVLIGFHKKLLNR